MIAAKRKTGRTKLPTRFESLVRQMPPRAILDDGHYDETVEMIDALMSRGRLTSGQSQYLETLVQLVQAYEAAHHAIDTSDLCGLDLLDFLLKENDLNATDLARLLDVHPSMGSKLLNGERSLTIPHIRKLAARFKVRPELFID